MSRLSEIAPGGIEKWASSLGCSFCAVWLYQLNCKWILEAQVEDHETFLECVDQAMERHMARFAMWSDGDRWTLLDRKTGDTRSLPSREAAEMAAMHLG